MEGAVNSAWGSARGDAGGGRGAFVMRRLVALLMAALVWGGVTAARAQGPKVKLGVLRRPRPRSCSSAPRRATSESSASSPSSSSSTRPSRCRRDRLGRPRGRRGRGSRPGSTTSSRAACGLDRRRQGPRVAGPQPDGARRPKDLYDAGARTLRDLRERNRRHPDRLDLPLQRGPAAREGGDGAGRRRAGAAPVARRRGRRPHGETHRCGGDGRAFVSRLETSGAGVTLIRTGDSLPWQIAVLLYADRFARDRARAVAFMKGYVKASRHTSTRC